MVALTLKWPQPSILARQPPSFHAFYPEFPASLAPSSQFPAPLPHLASSSIPAPLPHLAFSSIPSPCLTWP
ncbi:MAG: hypothetical protein LBE38_02930 [Deltaproteobacteria bacterium]|nr:hypothetical protein [Deltaproteobacteria bacterium]